MKLLHKNLRFKLGEIDLLMLDGEQHVIVEVKTRTRSGELLFENIDARKRRKLTSLANCYQVFYKRKNGITPKCRIDAVGVLLSSNQKKSTAQIEHLRSVL